MNLTERVKRLEADLEGAEAKIRLLEAQERIIDMIDNARDNFSEPATMQMAIAKGLKKEFGRENKIVGCILGVTDEENKDLIVPTAVVGALLKKCGGLGAIQLINDCREILGKSKPKVAMISWNSLNVMAMLVELKREVLGIIIIVGAYPFEANDQKLLQKAEDHIDSAIVQNRKFFLLKQKQAVIDVIDRIDKIRDQHLPFDETLKLANEEIHNTTQAEVGAIFLFNPNIGATELATITTTDIVKSKLNIDLLTNLATAALETGEMQRLKQDKFEEIRSVACIPLIMQDKRIGVIMAINHRELADFTRNDIELLVKIASMMDTAIFEGMDKENIKKALGRSVGDDVMEEMLKSGNADLIKPQKRTLTVLESDIRGFTALTEMLDPEQLYCFLNDHLGAMAEAVMLSGGMVDKFVGDAVLALFNAPRDQADHALRAIRTAFRMIKAHNELLERWRPRGVSNPIGIGISTGEAHLGEYGCSLRTDYTALGKPVNRACRINGSAQGNQILLWPSTYEVVRDMVEVEPVEGLTFKGIDGIFTGYRVLSIKE